MKSLSDIRALLRPSERRRLRVLVLLIAAMGVATLAGVFSIVPFIALLADPASLETHAVLAALYRLSGFSDRQTFVLALGTLFLLLVLVSNLINWAGSIVLSRFAYHLGHQWGVALFAHYLARDLTFHRASNGALLLSNLVWEVPRGVTQLLQAWFTLLSQSVSAALVLICVVAIQPLAALIIGVLLVGCYGAFYRASRTRLQRNGQAESDAAAARATVATQALGGIREVTVLGAQAAFVGRFDAASGALAAAACDTHALSLAPRHLLEAVLTVLLVGTALLLNRGGADAGTWLVPLSFLGFAAWRLLPALQQIFHSAVRIRADRVAFARIAADLQLALRAPAGSTRHTSGLRTGVSLRPAIELQAVSFRYEATRRWALRQLDLHVPPGQMLGVVGASGSGKSTLVELLLGLIEPTQGRILVDGEPLAGISRTAWHGRVAYVPQEIFLFDSSIAYNVTLSEEPEVDAPRLEEALRLAQLDAWIASLPEGVKQPVGERGVRVSGGQRQRLGIARALYRQASVLLLDEITSALDAILEDGIVSMLGTLKPRCTIILIAHRRNALRLCDRILDLDAPPRAQTVMLEVS